MPFFQDELYHWLCAPQDDGGAATKLKYSVKEYKELFEKAGEVRQKLSGKKASADELEKVGFVVGHLDVLGDGEKKELAVVLGKKDEGEEEDVMKGAVAGEEEPERLEEEDDDDEDKVPGPVAGKEIVVESQAPGKGKRDSKPVPSTKRKRKAATSTETSAPRRKSQRSK
jgi:hypothetical protein